jgi:hypothetical protein
MRALPALGALLALTGPAVPQTPAARADPKVTVTRLATCQAVNAHREVIAASLGPAADFPRAEALDQLYEEAVLRAVAVAASPDFPAATLRLFAVSAYGRTRLLLAQEFRGAAEVQDGEKTMAGHVGMIAEDAVSCEGSLADAMSD